MKGHKALLAALLLLEPGAWAQQAQDPLSIFAHEVCASPPSQIVRRIERFAAHHPASLGRFNTARLLRVVRSYHPATFEAIQALASAAGVSQGALPELGNDEVWNGVQLENAALRARAFGSGPSGSPDCPAAVARFDRGSAHLSYIATDHVLLAPSAREEIFRTIRIEFQNTHPGAVVVEGYPERFPCNEAVRLLLTPVARLIMEPEYLAKLALESGALVTGGEPEDIGLASPDRERFLLLRELTSVQGLDAEAAYHSVQTHFPFGSSISYSDFTTWYQRTNGHPFDLRNALIDSAPSYANPNPLATNRMSDQVDRSRDSHVVRMIRQGLLARGRVLALYGRDHFPRELPVFDAVFGRAPAPVARCGQPSVDAILPGCPSP